MMHLKGLPQCFAGRVRDGRTGARHLGEAWPVKLRYTLRGAAELDKVLVYIEERSPQGARHVQARIQAIINLLLQHPHAGQLTSKGRCAAWWLLPIPT